MSWVLDQVPTDFSSAVPGSCDPVGFVVAVILLWM